MEQETKRIRRTKEQVRDDKVEKLKEKITVWKKNIADAEEQIELLLNPPTPTVKMKDIKDKINELGLPLDEVMKAVEKMGKK